MHFVRDSSEIGQWNLHTLPQQAEGLRTVIKLRLISRSIPRAPTSSIGTFCQFSCFGYWAILAIGLFCSLGSFGYCARPLGHFCHQAIFAIKPFMGHLGPWAVWALGPFEPPAIAPGHWAVFAIRPFWPLSRLWAVRALGRLGCLC